MSRLAVLSMHTSPLAQPGTGDGGGMNVYVRELSSALARAGVDCDVYTRAWSDDLPAVVDVEPGFRVHHVPAGPLAARGQGAAPAIVDEFTEGVLKRMAGAGGDPDVRRARPAYDALHANYWLSGLAGHVLKHELDLPLVSTFHTLDRVKAEASPEEVEADAPHRRAEAEADIIRCSDAVLASCTVEAEAARRPLPRRPGPHPDRGPRGGPRLFRPRAPAPGPPGPRPIRPEAGPLLLFVGRIQPLKGADVAVRALAALAGRPSRRPPRGRRRPQRPPRRGRGRPRRRHGRRAGSRPTACTWWPPQPHELLSTYYRAADVCLVPSRSESFGLVALEAAACGTPVVASDVGGLTHPGRPRPHRVPGRGTRRRRLRRAGAPDPGAAAAGRAPGHRGGAPGPPLHVGPGRRLLGPSTRSSWRAPRGVPVTRPRRGCRRSPRDRRRAPTDDAVCENVSAGRPGLAERELPWWRSTASRVATRHGAPRWYLRLQGRGEGVRHRLVDVAPADAAPRGPGHARARGQHRGEPSSTCCGATPTSAACRSPSGPKTPSTWSAALRSERVDDDELDRILGGSLAYVDECFPTAMSLGFEAATAAPVAAATTAPGARRSFLARSCPGSPSPATGTRRSPWPP